MDDSRLFQEPNLATRQSHMGHIASYKQLQVKDLPKVPTWQLEWDSHQQPSTPKAPNTTTEPPYSFRL